MAPFVHVPDSPVTVDAPTVVGAPATAPVDVVPATVPNELITRLLDLLVFGRRGIVPAADLVVLLEMSPEDVAALLDASEARDYIEWWMSDLGPSVTLSGRVVRELDLELAVPADSTDVFEGRWVPARERAPERYRRKRGQPRLACDLEPSPKAQDGKDATRAVGLNSLADPRALGCVDLLAAADRSHAQLHAPRPKGGWRPRDLERYLLRLESAIRLVGLTHVWIRPHVPGTPCEGCGGRPLGWVEVCGVCDRSGFDELIPPLPRPVKTAPKDGDGRAGGRGKAQGKKVDPKPKVPRRTAGKKKRKVTQPDWPKVRG